MRTAARIPLRRPPRADRRTVLVSLTPAGRRLVAKIFPGHTAAITAALGALSPTEQATPAPC